MVITYFKVSTDTVGFFLYESSYSQFRGRGTEMEVLKLN